MYKMRYRQLYRLPMLLFQGMYHCLLLHVDIHLHLMLQYLGLFFILLLHVEICIVHQLCPLRRVGMPLQQLLQLVQCQRLYMFMWCDCYYNECWESSDAAPVPAICDTDMCSEADKDTPKISPKQAVAANARYEPPDILQR